MTEGVKKETPWEKFKRENPDKAIRNAKPWDLINPSLRVDDEIAEERFAICKACPELNSVTHTCKLCGCFMKQKTKLANAFCPMDPPKWSQVEITKK